MSDISIKRLKRRDRLYQMIPGLMLWSGIAIMFILSFTYPTILIYLVIFYITYFVYQSMSTLILVFKASKKISNVKSTNWEKKLTEEFGSAWKDYYQALLIPIANEGEDIVHPTVEAASKITYPKNRKIIIFATEKKYENGAKIAEKLKREYSQSFGKVIICTHTLKEGEIPGKASNENYAAREVYDILTKDNIDTNKVILTSNDADYRHEKKYFSYLTYAYLKTENNRSTIFQPIPIFYNNIWKVSIVSRIIATFAAQWQMAITFKPERFINFSCYALNLESLRQIGYWDANIIPEDERLFWKAIIAFGDDTQVIPLYIPVYGDAVLTDTFWGSIKEQYKQLRRWAWGASEMSFSIPNVVTHKKISRSRKFSLIFQQLRNSFERAMTPIIITFGDILPLLNSHFQKLSLSYTIPTFISRLMTITTLAIIIILVFEAKLAPHKNDKNILKRSFSYMGWITYPLVSIIFSSIPAIDAQTRLLLGKNIQYVPTVKKT